MSTFAVLTICAASNINLVGSHGHDLETSLVLRVWFFRGRHPVPLECAHDLRTLSSVGFEACARGGHASRWIRGAAHTPRRRPDRRRSNRSSRQSLGNLDPAGLRAHRYEWAHDASGSHRPSRSPHDSRPRRLRAVLRVARSAGRDNARGGDGDFGAAAPRRRSDVGGRAWSSRRRKLAGARPHRSGRDSRSAYVGERRVGRTARVLGISRGGAESGELAGASLGGGREAGGSGCRCDQSVGPA